MIFNDFFVEEREIKGKRSLVYINVNIETDKYVKVKT